MTYEEAANASVETVEYRARRLTNRVRSRLDIAETQILFEFALAELQDCEQQERLRKLRPAPRTVIDELLRDGRAHDAQMSDGPWRHHQSMDGGEIVSDLLLSAGDDEYIAHETDGRGADFNSADAAGIAWMRNNLSALLNALDTASTRPDLAETEDLQIAKAVAESIFALIARVRVIEAGK